MQAVDGPKTSPQRGSDQRQPRGGPDHSKLGQLEADRASGRPLADDDIEGEVFHRRVEHLFYGAPQAVDFVNKEHIPLAQVGKDRGQVSLFFYGRP